MSIALPDVEHAVGQSPEAAAQEAEKIINEVLSDPNNLRVFLDYLWNNYKNKDKEVKSADERGAELRSILSLRIRPIDNPMNMGGAVSDEALILLIERLEEESRRLQKDKQINHKNWEDYVESESIHPLMTTAVGNSTLIDKLNSISSFEKNFKVGGAQFDKARMAATVDSAFDQVVAQLPEPKRINLQQQATTIKTLFQRDVESMWKAPPDGYIPLSMERSTDELRAASVVWRKDSNGPIDVFNNMFMWLAGGNKFDTVKDSQGRLWTLEQVLTKLQALKDSSDFDVVIRSFVDFPIIYGTMGVIVDALQAKFPEQMQHWLDNPHEQLVILPAKPPVETPHTTETPAAPTVEEAAPKPTATVEERALIQEMEAIDGSWAALLNVLHRHQLDKVQVQTFQNGQQSVEIPMAQIVEIVDRMEKALIADRGDEKKRHSPQLFSNLDSILATGYQLQTILPLDSALLDQIISTCRSEYLAVML
jgi:hypothetical protein